MTTIPTVWKTLGYIRMKSGKMPVFPMRKIKNIWQFAKIMGCLLAICYKKYVDTICGFAHNITCDIICGSGI